MGNFKKQRGQSAPQKYEALHHSTSIICFFLHTWINFAFSECYKWIEETGVNMFFIIINLCLKMVHLCRTLKFNFYKKKFQNDYNILKYKTIKHMSGLLPFNKYTFYEHFKKLKTPKVYHKKIGRLCIIFLVY